MAAAANADSGGYRRTARRQTEFDGLTSGRQLPAPRTAYLIELQNSIRAADFRRLFCTLFYYSYGGTDDDADNVMVISLGKT